MSLSTVKLWARSFHWRQRLIEGDAQQARQQADRLAQGHMTDSERNLKIVRAALVKLARGIAEGRVRMQMGDLERLVRLEEHLAEVHSASQKERLSRLPPEAMDNRLRELSLEMLRRVDGPDWTRELSEARLREAQAQGTQPEPDWLLKGIRALPTISQPTDPGAPETADLTLEPPGD